MNPRQIYLLGPQDKTNILASVLERAGIDSRIALVTAGWEQGELEDQSVREAVGLPVVNLQLFERSEQLFENDPQIMELLRERQDRLRQLRDVYRMRLDHALSAARSLVGSPQLESWQRPEVILSIDDVRRLDRQYLSRTTEICDLFEARLQLADRPAVRQLREQIQEELQACSGLLIAGGHVAILLNRLRIFGLMQLAPELPIFAWSSGAMVLTRQIVLFHDSPPQGAGNAEVLRGGLGLVRDVVALPRAEERLNLTDKVRVELFARRFAPAQCITLEPGTWLLFEGGRCTATQAANRLINDGSLIGCQA